MINCNLIWSQIWEFGSFLLKLRLWRTLITCQCWIGGRGVTTQTIRWLCNVSIFNISQVERSIGMVLRLQCLSQFVDPVVWYIWFQFFSSSLASRAILSACWLFLNHFKFTSKFFDMLVFLVVLFYSRIFLLAWLGRFRRLRGSFNFLNRLLVILCFLYFFSLSSNKAEFLMNKFGGFCIYSAIAELTCKVTCINAFLITWFLRIHCLLLLLLLLDERLCFGSHLLHLFRFSYIFLINIRHIKLSFNFLNGG